VLIINNANKNEHKFSPLSELKLYTHQIGLWNLFLKGNSNTLKICDVKKDEKKIIQEEVYFLKIFSIRDCDTHFAWELFLFFGNPGSRVAKSDSKRLKIFRPRSGQFFVAWVGLDQPPMVWVWVWKISPKYPKFSTFCLQIKNILGQRRLGLLFTASQKSAGVRPEPTSSCLEPPGFKPWTLRFPSWYHDHLGTANPGIFKSWKGWVRISNLYVKEWAKYFLYKN